MSQIEIPSPVNNAYGLPVVTADALKVNAYIVWLHLRYTEVDTVRGAAQQCNGVDGHMWRGSLSHLLKTLWPAMDQGAEGAENANRRINRYLHGTNNAVCLDAGRMDPVSRRRKTHRLPEWFIADEWQNMQVTNERIEQQPEPVEEFEYDQHAPESEANPFDEDEQDTAQTSVENATEDDEQIVCRMGCGRMFASVNGRALHEGAHATIDAVLDACASLLIEHNGDPTWIGIDQIAERGGVTRQSVHNHFKKRMVALETAARLRGAPLLSPEEIAELAQTTAPQVDEAPKGELDGHTLTPEQWEMARHQILSLAAFGAYNQTPLARTMLGRIPWELSTDQRERALNSLLADGSLVLDTVRNGYSQTKEVLVPADPAFVLAPEYTAPNPAQSAPVIPAAAPADAVAVLKTLIAEYEALKDRDTQAAAREAELTARAEAAESVRSELDEIKVTMAKFLGTNR